MSIILLLDKEPEQSQIERACEAVEKLGFERHHRETRPENEPAFAYGTFVPVQLNGQTVQLDLDTVPHNIAQAVITRLADTLGPSSYWSNADELARYLGEEPDECRHYDFGALPYTVPEG